MNQIEEILSECGNMSRMAEWLDVTHAAVSQWVHHDGIPARQAIKIELLSRGRWRAIDLVGLKLDGERVAK